MEVLLQRDEEVPDEPFSLPGVSFATTPLPKSSLVSGNTSSPTMRPPVPESQSQDPGAAAPRAVTVAAAAGHCVSEGRIGTDEAIPFAVAALIVVLAGLTAVARAIPFPSVIAVGGVMVPVPMLKATETFGTG